MRPWIVALAMVCLARDPLFAQEKVAPAEGCQTSVEVRGPGQRSQATRTCWESAKAS